jgi:hypothetical protein
MRIEGHWSLIRYSVQVTIRFRFNGIDGRGAIDRWGARRTAIGWCVYYRYLITRSRFQIGSGRRRHVDAGRRDRSLRRIGGIRAAALPRAGATAEVAFKPWPPPGGHHIRPTRIRRRSEHRQPRICGRLPGRLPGRSTLLLPAGGLARHADLLHTSSGATEKSAPTRPGSPWQVSRDMPAAHLRHPTHPLDEDDIPPGSRR